MGTFLNPKVIDHLPKGIARLMTINNLGIEECPHGCLGPSTTYVGSANAANVASYCSS